MIKNDDRQIWSRLTEHLQPVNEVAQLAMALAPSAIDAMAKSPLPLPSKFVAKGIKKLVGSDEENPDADTYDAEGEMPGLIAELDPDEEEEGCPNLERLIKSDEDNEDEGKETINVNDEADTFEEVEAHTYE